MYPLRVSLTILFPFPSMQRNDFPDSWAGGGVVPAPSITCIGLANHILVIMDSETEPCLSIALPNDSILLHRIMSLQQESCYLLPGCASGET